MLNCSNCKRSFAGELAELSWEFDLIFPFTSLDLASRLHNVETPDIDRHVVENFTEHSWYIYAVQIFRVFDNAYCAL